MGTYAFENCREISVCVVFGTEARTLQGLSAECPRRAQHFYFSNNNYLIYFLISIHFKQNMWVTQLHERTILSFFSGTLQFSLPYGKYADFWNILVLSRFSLFSLTSDDKKTKYEVPDWPNE